MVVLVVIMNQMVLTEILEILETMVQVIPSWFKWFYDWSKGKVYTGGSKGSGASRVQPVMVQ